MDYNKINTLGQLKESGYKSKSIKDEIRANLITKLSDGDKLYEGIIGFDNTVIPDIERALLSRHNILLLGLRGQAKTRIARLTTQLLDEHIPVIKGSELNDDPLNPITKHAHDLIAEYGDDTPIEWISNSDRYVEKLATPDVSISDLIGDVDPIKAASLKLPYSDERVIHFGLVPRAHRSIFVINELPDLQARIQVSLFNILQEGDLQIRGFKLRLPLDILFIFTANPEDYTNRGSIVTPLKDRIESQILTHYPSKIETSKKITAQEVRIATRQKENISVPELIKDLLEMVAFEARESELIDDKSGVSARLSISAMENLISTAERRMLINGENNTSVRICDFWGIIPSITGKVELVYEGEQEGPYNVALQLINNAIKEIFLESFPDPERLQQGESDPYGALREYFNDGNELELLNDESDISFYDKLRALPGLLKMLKNTDYDKSEEGLLMELVIHGLVTCNVISKDFIQSRFTFRDVIANMMDDLNDLGFSN